MYVIFCWLSHYPPSKGIILRLLSDVFNWYCMSYRNRLSIGYLWPASIRTIVYGVELASISTIVWLTGFRGILVCTQLFVVWCLKSRSFTATDDLSKPCLHVATIPPGVWPGQDSTRLCSRSSRSLDLPGTRNQSKNRNKPRVAS